MDSSIRPSARPGRAAASASLPGWKRAVLGVGIALSAIAAVYIAFAHVLAFSRRRAPDARDSVESFATADALPSAYRVTKSGELAWSVKGGALRVDGSAHAGDEVVFHAGERRFDDAVISVRFRGSAGQPLEAFVGLEQEDGVRAVRAAYVAGPTSFVHVGGDVSSSQRPANEVEDVTVDPVSDDWHTLAIQFSPATGAVIALLDGKQLMSTRTGWIQGTRARPIFGVKARGDVASVGVAFDSLSIRSIDWQGISSFDETFDGEFADPERWVFLFPDPDLATLESATTKHEGLFLRSRARGGSGTHVPMMLVRTHPFFLRNLDVAFDLSIEDLHKASMFVGIFGASASSNIDRVFDVGFRRDETGAHAYVAGAWTNTGHISFDGGPDVTLPHTFHVELRYDPKTSMGRALLDGKLVAEHRVDLKPLEIVALRIGADGSAADARAEGHVRRVVLHSR